MAGGACTNRPRLCQGGEVDAYGPRLETWRGPSPHCSLARENHLSCQCVCVGGGALGWELVSICELCDVVALTGVAYL